MIVDIYDDCALHFVAIAWFYPLDQQNPLINILTAHYICCSRAINNESIWIMKYGSSFFPIFSQEIRWLVQLNGVHSIHKHYRNWSLSGAFVLIRFFCVSIEKESRSKLFWGRSIKINFFRFWFFKKKPTFCPLTTNSHSTNPLLTWLFTAALQMKLTVCVWSRVHCVQFGSIVIIKMASYWVWQFKDNACVCVYPIQSSV